MTKQILVSAISAIMLTACGGGGSSSSPSPSPSPNTNTAPQISEAKIIDVNGEMVKAGDVLAFTYNYSDAENDAEGDSRIEWLLNDEVISSASTAEYTVLANQQGQQITARITPVALTGETDGVSSNSNTLTVMNNGAPSFSALTLSAETANVGDSITIAYTYQDEDSDAEGVHVFRWYRDGAEIVGASDVSYTIKAEDRGTSITATATPIALSGILTGAVQSVSNAVVISAANQPPTASNVILTDDNGGLVRPGDTLTVTYDYNDVDGDLENDSLIGWSYFSSNGSGNIAGPRGSATYIVSSLYAGQEIGVTIFPSAIAGDKNGPVARSNRVSVITPALPTAAETTITDVNGGELIVGDILQSSYTYADGDGDAEQGTTFIWMADDQEIAGATSATYTIAATDEGKTIKLNVTPHSEFNEQGSVYESNVLIVKDLAIQELTFASESAQKMVVSASFTNVATGLGSGDVSYASSDETIATIDASGKISAHRAGEVTITSSIAADNFYSPADASYELSIRSNVYPIKGWVGEHELTFRFYDNSPQDLTVYGTSDEQCDTLSINACSNPTQFNITEGAAFDSFHDQQGELNTNRYYTAEYGDYQGRIQISQQDSTIQYGAAIVFFKDKLWALGGRIGNGGSNQIWSSVDGRSWQQESTDASQLFTERQDTQVVEFNGKLWMTGGYHYVNLWPNPSLSEYYADIWSSEDGIHWDLETNEAPFSPRSNHQMVVANGALWLTGGDTSRDGTRDNKYWRSEDGINWQDKGLTPTFGYNKDALLSVLPGEQVGDDRLVLAERGNVYIADVNGVFPTERSAYTNGFQGYGDMLEFNGVLYLVDGYQKKVSKSVDGLVWEQVALAKPMTQLLYTTPLVFKNKMWLFAGRANNEPVAVYAHSSVDGASWEIETDDAEFAERYGMSATTFNNQLIAAGGNIGGHYKSDVWQSADGIEWDQLKAHVSGAGNPFYGNAEMIEFGGKLWAASQDTLHSSEDGATWEEVSFVNYPAFNPSYGFPQFNLMLHNRKFWLMGAHKDDNDQLETRISSSNDGITWTSHIMTQPFGVVQDFKAITFNNKLWVFGGKNVAGQQSTSSWSSSDGLVWEEHIAATTSLPGYTLFDVVEMDGKLWVAGGNTAGQFSDEVWSTSDGIDWTQVTNNAAFGERGYHSLVAHDNELYIIGSRTVARQNDNEVWKSADGIAWYRAFQNKIEFDLEPAVRSKF